MKISVITPTLNSARTIRETIQSVVDQDYSDREHIVMDGGSTDATLDMLRSFPHLIWSSGKDEGHYHAMNKGVEKSTGEIVAILNADDCYRKGALTAVAESFKAHPEWDALFGDVVYIDGGGMEIYRREEACFDYDVLRYGLCIVIHPTLFMKRSVFDRLGGFNYRKYKNAADYDLILRLARERFVVGHIPRLLVNYRIHDYGQTADKRIQFNTRRESLIIREEHGLKKGVIGMLQVIYGKMRRQGQKLAIRGKVDLMPGTFYQRKHLREKTNFSSNIGLDRL